MEYQQLNADIQIAVVAEEKWLEQQYAERYLAYKGAVPRFLGNSKS